MDLYFVFFIVGVFAAGLFTGLIVRILNSLRRSLGNDNISRQMVSDRAKRLLRSLLWDTRVQIAVIDRVKLNFILRKNQNLTTKFLVNWGSSNGSDSGEFSLRIVVPFFNNAEITGHLLNDIHREMVASQKSWSKISCVVIDDFSDSSEGQQISNDAKRLGFEYTRREKNLGFLGNCNLEYVETETDFVLFLNSDVRLPPDFLSRLAVHTDPVATGLVTVPSFEDLTSLGAYAPTWWELDNRLSQLGPVQIEACTAVGYALLVNRAKVCAPLFNPDFGHGYGEDSDLHYRVEELGLSSVFALNMLVYHQGGASYGESSESNSHRAQGRDLFMSKWGNTYHREFPVFKKHVQEFLNGFARVELPANGVFLVTPSVSSLGIGGLSVIEDAANELAISGIPVRFVEVLNETKKARESRGAVSVYPFKDFLKLVRNLKNWDNSDSSLLVYGGMDSMRRLEKDGVFHANTFVTAVLVQGPDFLMEPENSVLFAKSIADSSVALAVSKPMEEMAKSFGAQDVRTFTPRNFKSKIGNGSPSENERAFDLVVSIRNEHGKAAWLSVAIANYLHSEGYKVASFGNDSEKLDKGIVQHGVLEPHILEQLLLKSKVFFDSSLYEGFGMVPREALAAGVRVVAVSNGGNLDLLSAPGFVTVEQWNIPEILGEIKSMIARSYATDELIQSGFVFSQTGSLSEKIKEYWLGIDPTESN